jgi:predicted DNA-binding transcriptional regulator YafY
MGSTSPIRIGRKIRIRYRDERSRETERTIWPTIIGYAETVRHLAAWCELRQVFRHFRTDRIVSADFLQEPCGCRPGDSERAGTASWSQSAFAPR